MLVALMGLMVLFLFGYPIMKAIEKCFPSFAIGNIEVKEDLDTYWASLDDEDRKWAKAEELNSRIIGMPMLSDAQFSMLNTTAMTEKKSLQGCHSYDILCNPQYFDNFQYVTAAEEDRNDIIIDDDENEGNDSAQSDFIRVALNLAYFHPTQVEIPDLAAKELNTAKAFMEFLNR